MNFLTCVWACRVVLSIIARREGANIILVGSEFWQRAGQSIWSGDPRQRARAIPGAATAG